MQKLLLFIVIILLSGDLHVQNINFFLNMQCGYQQVVVKMSPVMIDLAIQQPDSLLLKGPDDMILLVFAAFLSKKVCYNEL